MREIRRKCLNLLSRREYGREELKRKLSGKGYPREAVDGVVDDLAAAGWQSDVRFADAYLRQRIVRGVGPARLVRELHQRGLAEADANRMLGEQPQNWDDVIEEVYRKKYRDAPPKSLNELSKRARFLQYRGFTVDQIKSLFERLGHTF